MEKDNDSLIVISKSKNINSDLHPLLQQVQNNTLSILVNSLNVLFRSCDDLFFDLSNRAKNNNDQILYFETMRELRIKKAGMSSNFQHLIEQDFTNCFLGKTISKTPKTHSPIKNETLTLVQNDELEREVAIKEMITNARIKNQESLYQLVIRFDSLIDDHTITKENNPLDPRQLCSNFALACEIFELKTIPVIVLFKQFDHLVISQLTNMYSSINNLLINSGVLPNINLDNKNQASTKGGTTDENQSDTAIQNFSFSGLATLLDNLRHIDTNRIPKYRSFVNNPGQLMLQHELLATLSLLQAQLVGMSTWPQAPNTDLRTQIEAILAKSNPASPKSLKQPEEDTINLVAMFFDFVLDDRNLQGPIVNLISRLQIPTVKVAMRDHSFFSNSQHPARLLVNNLASFSIGWDETNEYSKDKFYNQISSIVQDIAANQDEDVNIFPKKLVELQKLIERDDRRRKLVEKRTCQSANGKAITEKAKSTSQKMLYSLLKKCNLPAVINEFLIVQWQQFLMITLLKHGEDSNEWLDASQLVQDLIWACNPLHDEKSKMRLSKIKTPLLERIEAGIKEIATTDEECSARIQPIREIIDMLPLNNRTSLFEPLTVDQIESLEYATSLDNKQWKDMSEEERHESDHHSPNFEFIQQAESLAKDTWLSYEDESENRTLRCKLSERLETSGNYIFVNRFGFQVLEKTRNEFAFDLENGKAKPFESGLLYDRALNHITNELQQSA